jgi:hypothetical protein
VLASRRARSLAKPVDRGPRGGVPLRPFTFASTPAAGRFRWIAGGALAAMRCVHPYIEAMFLQHGYAFSRRIPVLAICSE